MSRQIGQRAKLNGKPVYWSGDDYGWQSKASHDKLKKEGAFKIGAQTVRRLTNLVGDVMPEPVKKYARAVQEGTARNEQQLSESLRQTPAGRFVDDLRQQDATGDAVRVISDATNVDPRLIQGAAAIVETVAEGKLGASTARRLARAQQRVPRGVTPPTRQGAGTGLPNRVQRLRQQGQRQRVRRERGALGGVHPDFDRAMDSARRDGTSVQVGPDGN